MTTTKFAYGSTHVQIFKITEGQIQEKLLPEIYVVKSSMEGFYLSRDKQKYSLPPKLYGSISKKADKIIDAFKRREKSTGILFSGNKGSGKTETVKYTANKMLEAGYPVVLVNEPYTSQEFIEFIEQLGEVVVLFDEFGKVYEKNKSNDDVANPQESLLTLFDGTASNKRLILLTENDVHKISDFMLNRPGRIYYHFKYNKIEAETINQYSEDKRVKESFLKSMLETRDLVNEFSFDNLKAIVDEHLAYPDEEFDTLVADLNIDLPAPAYEFKVESIKSPLIDVGILVQPEDYVIKDFYYSRNNVIRLDINPAFLAKFEDPEQAKREVISVMRSSRSAFAVNFKILMNKYKDAPRIKDLKEVVPQHVPVCICDDFFEGSIGEKDTFFNNSFFVVGEQYKVKKSFSYHDFFN